MSDHDTARLCAGYRATLQDPPYDAADAAVMRAAARQVHEPHRLPVRGLSYGIAAAVLAALGLAAGMRALTWQHRPSIVAARTARGLQARRSQARASPSSDYLTNATLGSAATGFLQQTSAVSTVRTKPTCGMAAEIDLNAPGALARLRTGEPGDYVRIMRMIAGVTRHPELDVARWISAAFHAGEVSYLPLWLSSLPPQRRLSFCLGSTRYAVVLTITSKGARLSPAAWAPATK